MPVGMRRIGIEPGKSFSFAAASPEVQQALQAAAPEAVLSENYIRTY
jgi:hypothetical protein